MRVIKPKRMSCAGHVARMGEGRRVDRVLVGNVRERDYLEHPGVDGMIIIRWFSGSGMGEYGMDPAGSG